MPVSQDHAADYRLALASQPDAPLKLLPKAVFRHSQPVRGDVPFNPQAEVSDTGLAELGERIAGPEYELVTRYFEAAPGDVLTVALEELGAFIANNDDPLPHLERIQAVAVEYWDDQE